MQEFEALLVGSVYSSIFLFFQKCKYEVLWKCDKEELAEMF